MGIRIELHPYDLGAYFRDLAERKRQRELTKNMAPVMSQESRDTMKNDPDLLKGIKEYMSKYYG